MYDIETQRTKLKALLSIVGITYDDTILDYELDSAKEVINTKRRHIPTEEVPLEEQYFSLQIRMAKSAIMRYGTEGQSSHNELGIGEVYESGSPYSSRDLNSILPKARVLYASGR